VRRLTLTFAMLLALLASGPAGATLTIQITGGATGAMPIAVVPFGWQGKAAKAPVDVSKVVRDDLARSGYFAPIGKSQLPAQPTHASDVNFQQWRNAGVDTLVIGRIQQTSENKFELRFHVFDALRGKQVTAYQIPVDRGHLRYSAHHVSDLIYEKLTGKPGAFETRIAYVSVKHQNGSKVYRLMVADADGYDPRAAVTAREPILSPAWSPDGRKLAYVEFVHNRPRIYVQDLATGKRRVVSKREGLNGAPAWSPDGHKLAITLSPQGNADIYILDLKSGKLTQVTHDPGIDTEPSWSPDGKKLAFTSDRGGSPQVYEMTLANHSVQRLTFENGYNASPHWSPDGKSIALVTEQNGKFDIGVLNVKTGSLRVLSDGPRDESPSFAPNGSMIMYASNDGDRGVLATVSFDGGARQRLSGQNEDVQEPAWGPFSASERQQQ